MGTAVKSRMVIVVTVLALGMGLIFSWLGRRPGSKQEALPSDQTAASPPESVRPKPLPVPAEAPLMKGTNTKAKRATETNVNFAEVDRELQRMPLGRIAYNAPATMVEGEHHDIYLLLSPTQSPEDLQKELQSRLSGHEILETAQIKISERMQASLSGPDFAIDPNEPQIQPVSSTQPTEWRWSVTPKKTGLLELRLDLYALLILNGGSPIPRKIRTFDTTIKVRVAPLQLISGFVVRNWQWLWATVFVPVAGWLWAKRKKTQKRRRALPKSQSPDEN